MTQYGNRDLGEEYQQGIFDMLKGAKDLWLESGMGLLNPNNPTVKHFSNPSKGTTLPSLLDDPAALESLSLDPGGLGFMRGMTKVFHGSPHLFKNWDSKKMGTGEGAQAYGHGGYFAGSEKVGKHYADVLLNDKIIDDINPNSIEEEYIINKIRQFRNEIGASPDKQTVGEWIAQDYSPTDYGYYFDQTGEYLNKNNIEKAFDDIYEKMKGRLYEIELKPNPEDFLDWSKPLSDQSPAIKTKLSKFFDKSNKSFFKDVYDDWQRYLDDIPEEAQTIAKKMVADEISITDGKTWTRLGELAPDADHNMIHNYRDYAFGFGGPGTSKMTGEAFYRRLEDVMGVKQAPDALSSEGIYGHRYEDAMSRGGRPAKNYNYVVYPTQDPEMIKIMNPPSLID